MTIVAATTIYPNPGVNWEDVQKRIKEACDLACKHGAEDVTVLVTMTGGRATDTIGERSSAEDWVRYM
jgi:sugar phosphate isomerase/epimerase